MIDLYSSEERGHADHAWLDSRHTFSFADYFDREKMGFRTLRVINEDWVHPSQGFGTHPHRDMEIITYIISGALEHKDSMGNGSVIRPGDVQRMTAGTGVAHSEVNPSPSDRVHLLQIWILPERKGLTPSYEQKTFPPEERKNRLRLLVSPDQRDGAVKIHQDAALYGSILDLGTRVEHPLQPGRHAWIQVISGRIRVNGTSELHAGDGAAISDENTLAIEAVEPSEFLVFDLN